MTTPTKRSAKARKAAKAQVIKAHPTAVSRPPNPRGLYYDKWTVVIPPTSVGIFGPMTQIIGKGSSAKEAWADAAASLTPAKKTKAL